MRDTIPSPERPGYKRRAGHAAVTSALVLALIVAPCTVLWYAASRTASPLAADASPLPMTAAPVMDEVVQTHVVGLTLERQDGLVVRSSSAGVVTTIDVKPGSIIRADDRIGSVGDTPIFAFTGSAPLHRSLGVGSKGRDVQRLQRFLHEAGLLRAGPDGHFGRETAEAVERWNESHGRAGRTFDVEAVAWIGDGPLTVATILAHPGDRLDTNAGLVQGPQVTMAVTIDSNGVPPGDYDLSVGGASVSYTSPGAVTRADDVAALDSAVSQDAAAGTLTSRSGTPVLVVPASALVTDLDGAVCIFPDAEAAAVRVRPLGSRGGTVHLPSDTPISSVLANPAAVREDLRCG